MVKLKFWSIYSHIETSVIKIMRDIHANTLFVVKCSKKAPSQAKWWDLSDLHIQNIGEIDKIWVSVKIWLIQYNLSEFAHFVSEYIKRASSRHHSYFLLSSSSSGHSDAKPRRKKNQVSDPEHGETSQLVLPPPPGPGDCVAMLTSLSRWAGDMLWPRALASGAWHPVVTRPIVRWPAPMGWPVPVSELASQWPSLSVQGFKLTPGICHLSSPTSRETKPFNATHQELLISTRKAGQREEPLMGISLGNVTNVMVSPQIWDFIVDIRQERYCVNYKRLGERVGMMLHILHNITKYPD